MRISDWSSDVCSSDLAKVPLIRGLDFVTDEIRPGFEIPLRIGRIAGPKGFRVHLCHKFVADNFVALSARRHNQRQRDAGHPSRGGIFVPSHRSEEHTSELQSLMRISYAVFCLKKNKQQTRDKHLNT